MPKKDFRLTEELEEQLEQYCRENHVNASKVCREALKKHIIAKKEGQEQSRGSQNDHRNGEAGGQDDLLGPANTSKKGQTSNDFDPTRKEKSSGTKSRQHSDGQEHMENQLNKTRSVEAVANIKELMRRLGDTAKAV